MTFKTVPFLDAVKDVSAGNTKVPRSEFLAAGDLAVVDQGQSLVAGYTDDTGAAVKTESPVIVFGDHTRAFKFVDFPFAMGADGVKVLRTQEGFDPRFTYHYLRSISLPNAGYSRHFKFLKEISVPSPPLDEQRRIAAVLDHADVLRIKRRQVIAHLSRLVESAFVEMFDGYPSRGLGELVDFYSGATPSKSNAALWDGDLPWFSAKDLKAPDLFDSMDHVSRVVPVDTNLRLLPPDTITIVVRGMILAHSVPVSTLRVAATINQDLKALLPRVDVHPDFLATALRVRKSWILPRVTTAAHGTKKLESHALESVPVPDVTPARQQMFAEIVAAITRQRTALKQALSTDDRLFASLQSRAFQGKL